MPQRNEPKDLARVEPSLVLSVFAASGPFAVIAPIPTLVTGLGVLLCYSRSLSVGLLCFILCGVGLGSWRAHDAVHRYESERAEAATLLRPPARCAIVGHVVSSLVVRDGTPRLRVRITQADCEGRRRNVPFLARLYGGPDSLRRGDTVQAVVQIGVVRLFRNHDLVNPVPFAARSGEVASGSVLSLEVIARARGLPALIDRARAHVRRRITETFAADAVGLAKALVLGENDLTEEEDHSFKVSGLAHLLAVSGTHLIFAVLSVVMGARAVLVRCERIAAGFDVARLASAFGILLAVAYADFAGGSGSAWRAAWMLCVGFALRSAGREVQSGQCVAWSILIGTVVDPLIGLDLSFLLSLAATAGLMTLGRNFAARISNVPHKGLRLFLLSAAATVASTIPCSIVLAPLATEVSLVGVLANCLAAPFGEMVALPLCLLHGLTSWAEPLERGLSMVASGALLVVRRVALFAAQAEGSGLPIPYLDRYQYASATLFGAALLARHLSHSRGVRQRSLACAAAAGVCFGIAEWRLRELGQPKHQLRVTFLDVGQGDSTLIDLPDGSLMLVDGGGFVGVPIDPGDSVILPVLRARRRTRLDTVVLSHPHPDHFGGLRSVLTRIEVREFWDTGQGQQDGERSAYSALLDIAARRSVRLRTPAELCDRTEIGGARLRVFGPCPTFSPGRSANDNSLVLQIGYKEKSVLLVGDAEREQERALLEVHGLDLRSTLLKVGHHGSRTSSSVEFLQAVQPQLAVISCGIRNRFGHPHPETIHRLGSQGIRVWRVDEYGSAVWSHPQKRAVNWP